MDEVQNHILYIEYHADIRDLVSLILSDSNYRVTTASNTREVLKLAREQQFDLYILDSWLPDGSGIDLCKRLREFDHATPIMFLSAAAYETDKQAALESGAQRYLVKPNDIQKIRYEADALIIGFATKQAPDSEVAIGHTIDVDDQENQTKSIDPGVNA